ncbi:MAG: hypothetical protein KTR32_02950, partial [Granulosicoccus sp.]|nr:hypothetical protein [Granulosicoccus sp.]
YLSAEWPPEIAEFVKSHRVIDLVHRLMEARPQEQTDRHDCQINPVQASYPTQLEDLLSNHEVCPDSLNNCSMLQMVSDWYCIRQAGHMAKHHIHLDKLKIYEFLSQEFGKDTKASRDDLVKFMGPFLAILRQALDAIRPLDKLVSTDVVTLHGNKQTI